MTNTKAPEMVERVARAMCEADAKRRKNPFGGPEYGVNLERFRVMARAAIEAMRTPSGKMLLAADDASAEPEAVNRIWAAMIDASLSQTEG